MPTIAPRPVVCPPPVEGAAWIPLTRGKFALVDAADFDALSRYRWSAAPIDGCWYAERKAGGRSRRMHRVVLGAGPGDTVDHANGNGLDNRRANLRVCTVSQNNCNKVVKTTQRFRGITPARQKGSAWCAVISVRRERFHLGTFPTEEAAARAYDEAARRLHGPFARLNFPTAQEASAA